MIGPIITNVNTKTNNINQVNNVNSGLVNDINSSISTFSVSSVQNLSNIPTRKDSIETMVKHLRDAQAKTTSLKTK